MPVEAILNAVASGQTLVVLLLLGAMWRLRGDTAKGWLFGFFGLTLLDVLVQLREAIDANRVVDLGLLILPLYPLFPVLFWLHIRALTSQGVPARPWAHGGWSLLALALLSPAIATNLAAVFGQEWDAWLIIYAEIALQVFAMLWAALLLAYGGMTMYSVHQHRGKLQEHYSNLVGRDLAWVDSLLVALGVFIVIKVAEAACLVVFDIDILPATYDAAYEMLLVLMLGVYGILQAPPTSDVEKPTHNYARSPLTAQDCQRLASKLDAAMEKDNLWTDPFLDLTALSSAAGVSHNKISQTLSTARETNFFGYVNRYRVEHAKRLLAETHNNIIDICEEVGFNSKSTFNAAFKKEVGVTPRAFRLQSEQIRDVIS